MNKKEILETLKWALYSETVSEWDAHLAGDAETSKLYWAGAQGQIKLAHQLLGSRYYHKINSLVETVKRKAAADAAAKRQQKLGA